MSLNVHFTRLPEGFTLEMIEPLVPPTVHFTAGPQTAQPEECDILIGGRVTAEQIEASPRLRAVIVPFAGVPVEIQEVMRRYPAIDLHNLHFNDIPTAEMALTLMFAAAKYLVPLDRRLRQGDWRWDDESAPTDTFAGKTAVILGYGAIGRRLAPVCQALGMRVVGIRRHKPAARSVDGVELYAVDALHDLLPQADVLLCLLPQTPETVGLLGARELALLPPHALLVNVGRGPVIDEEALYQTLRDRRIRGAGIDVWYTYPESDDKRGSTLPSRFPFHELDNVVMSPHRGGWTASFEHLRARALAELLTAAAEGRAMANRVNKELGY